MNDRRSAGRARGALIIALTFAAAIAAQEAVVPAPNTATAVEQRLAGENLIAEAALQAELDEFDAAEATYLEGIELLTSADGEFAPLLIDAYRGLASVFAARGDYAEAVTVLEQAQHISHRNFGLFNLDQTELLEDLSTVYDEAGDTREAQETQREILNVAVRHFGSEQLGVIPYHYGLAEYYDRARMRARAREQYEIVLDILAEDPQAQPGDALKPLRELLRIDTITGENSPARKRLIDVLAANSGVAALERAEALAALGDAALVDGDAEIGVQYYRDAYLALAAHDSAAADGYFASPRIINFVPPPGPVDFGRRARRPYAWGSITARFALSPGGRASQIEIVNSDPPGLMDSGYARRLAEAVFRPRIAAGTPVATPRLRYTHTFRYFVEE
jgi:tetratricopeptide (TPR) repeat protein